MGKVIAAYGGGFKPPTGGHFEIVKNALAEFPEIDEFIIYVGSKERDGIDQAEAILVWEIYENYLANKVVIKPAKSPIGDILRLAKDNPQDEIYFVIGYREGRDDDMKDVTSRTSNLEEKYPNIEVKVMPTFDANMSGTNARKAIGDEEKFIKFLPDEVQEKSQIWNIVRPAVEESITENATYSQNIDYMQMISDLTNYMIEKGRNIEPLPELVIKNGETENAKNFFGRTAYYDPNTQTIVLYTEGRHPKDIVRSYAHEMVHHTQYLEDRLPNVQTTDTTASKELDAIEREAYLDGNMIFRNWTDSIDGDVYSSLTEKKLKESKAILNWEKRVTIPGPVPPAFLEGDVLTYEGYKNRRGNVTGKLFPQRDYPVEVIEVKWNEDKKEYVYKIMLLRDLGIGEKRGMKVSGKSEKEIKDKLADKQLTRAEFERQISSGRGRNDSFDKPIKLPKKGSTFGWTGESKILKEVLDPINFDFKPLIKSLTASMEKDGLNLQPYPTIRFIHDEEANADDFFGKTAYYDPNKKEVVLYTLGRHPKDIMRSYAHELIHVHQDNEDRLGVIQTDDVNADENLENLEREAYETGNIMFRSWTNRVSKDQLNEGKKKVKDPFGINAFARELAMGLEEQENISEPNIYLDMDGVVANFDKRFEDLSGMLPQAYVDKNGLNAFWDLIDEKHKVAFWRGIEVMPGAEKLVNFVSQYPYQMLTAPSVKKQSIIGKGLWVKDKVGTLYPSKPKVFYRKAKLKHTVKPELTKNDILIDDRADTIGRWDGAGGTAILFQSADQVINDLKKLGL